MIQCLDISYEGICEPVSTDERTTKLLEPQKSPLRPSVRATRRQQHSVLLKGLSPAFQPVACIFTLTSSVGAPIADPMAPAVPAASTLVAM